MRSERAQEPREGLMLGFVEVALAAEKHDPMAQQDIAGSRSPSQPADRRTAYTMDLPTDRRRDRANNPGPRPDGRNWARREISTCYPPCLDVELIIATRP